MMDRWITALFLLALTGSVSVQAQQLPEGGYAHPEMLVETEWVARHEHDRNVRLVDMRDAAAYAAGHIPQAVHIEEGPLRNPEDRFTYLPSPKVFAQMMEKVGIGNGTHVVIYDDQGGKMAARLWYVLNAYGHMRASLVNGGWNKWVAEKRPVTQKVPTAPPVTFVPKETPTLTCPSPALLARSPGTVVLDARSPEEYRGETVSPGALKAGRIPGAVNVEWKDNVTGPYMEFKPAAALRKMYAKKGITTDRQIVVHCASGGRAAESLFTLKLLGYPHIKIYYGSFADYSARPEEPIEK
ncbi:MAG TPA: sulfurtransferase [Chthonomonadaceae bacterium]|nr:sulfurtransferase [Chthonomonadaceae bacterium]